MKYRIVEVPFCHYVNICIQVKRWYGWVTFKMFDADYADPEGYEYFVREAEEIVEILNKE